MQPADFGGSPRIGVGGVDFDAFGNLWFTNAYAENGLHVRLQDGSFETMGLGNALGNDGWLGQVLVARNGYIWCIMPRNQGLLVYDTNKTPENTNDDDWRVLTSDANQGGLPSDDVYSIEEDLDGEIWVGTAAGPCVIYLPSLVFDTGNENPVASQILIQQDGIFNCCLKRKSSKAFASMVEIENGSARKIQGCTCSVPTELLKLPISKPKTVPSRVIGFLTLPSIIAMAKYSLEPIAE